METLIDWTKEGSETFAYPEKRVAELIASVRSNVKGMEEMKSKGKLATELYDWGPILELRSQALEEWGDPSKLAIEATRFLDIERRIDEINGLDQGHRLEQFLDEIGGEQKFRLVFEALSCSGALHDIASAITNVGILKSLKSLST